MQVCYRTYSTVQYINTVGSFKNQEHKFQKNVVYVNVTAILNNKFNLQFFPSFGTIITR